MLVTWPYRGKIIIVWLAEDGIMDSQSMGAREADLDFEPLCSPVPGVYEVSAVLRHALSTRVAAGKSLQLDIRRVLIFPGSTYKLQITFSK